MNQNERESDFKKWASQLTQQPQKHNYRHADDDGGETSIGNRCVYF